MSFKKSSIWISGPQIGSYQIRQNEFILKATLHYPNNQNFIDFFIYFTTSQKYSVGGGYSGWWNFKIELNLSMKSGKQILLSLSKGAEFYSKISKLCQRSLWISPNWNEPIVFVLSQSIHDRIYLALNSNVKLFFWSLKQFQTEIF